MSALEVEPDDAQNTGKAPGKPWKPGQSGNPGGRPAGLAKRVRELISPDQLASFYIAVATNDQDKLDGFKVSMRDRMEAANWLADRGYGKAATFTAVEDGDPLDLNGIPEAAERFGGQVVRLVDSGETPKPA